MILLLEIGLTNAVMATAIGVLAGVVGGVCRRPALSHSLWLLVLLKLITPPLLLLPIPSVTIGLVAGTATSDPSSRDRLGLIERTRDSRSLAATPGDRSGGGGRQPREGRDYAAPVAAEPAARH